MRPRKNWISAFIWGPVPATVAAVMVATQGLMEQEDRLPLVIIASAAFLVVHATVSYVLDSRLVTKAYERTNRLMRKLLDLLAALGAISGGNHQLWKIALYVPRRKSLKPWAVELVRLVPLFLTSRAPVPDVAQSVTAGPIGISYREKRSFSWSCEEPEQLRSSDGQVLRNGVDKATSGFLTANFGALRAFPVTDESDRECLGILVVYCEPGDASAVLGTLFQDAAAEKIRQSALAIYDVLEH